MTRDGAPAPAAVAPLAGFVVAALGAVGFVVAYALDAPPPVYGTALLCAFGGLGFGLVTWAHRLMPAGGRVEPREHMAVATAEEDRALATIYGQTEPLPRRRLLWGAFLTAVGATGAALLVPLGSLGPAPGDALRRTAWGRTPHPRVVDENGRSVRPGDLAVGEVLTVFPAGDPGSANAQTVLIRLPDGVRLQSPGRQEWVVDGLVAYSKVCTHAGCPVGLYVVEEQQLFCPCHQSAFAVLAGAVATTGPAVRALPQLPLGLDGDGYLIALGDFPASVGPGWWTQP